MQLIWKLYAGFGPKQSRNLLLDAAIFSSFDGDAWTDENVVWWKDEGP
jgi:hypothetical protein